MPMSMMQMVFYTSSTTPLYSMSWAPMTTATYALTCIFFIGLGSAFRACFAVKRCLERAWSDQENHRRRVLVMGRYLEEDQDVEKVDPKIGPFVVEREVEKKQIVITSTVKIRAAPWRLSVDVPRAALVTVTGGIGYLL